MLTRLAQIRLADEADFMLGGISVHPALCSLEVGGREETVEPRVMQVLVALVAAKDTVVSRDDLVQSCWGGRIVGDDAINGCLVKVRKLAGLAEAPTFRIETIPRVGYRLRNGEVKPSEIPKAGDPPVPPAETKPQPHVTPLPRTGWTRRRKVMIGLATAVVCGGLLGSAWVFSQKPARWMVARSEVLIAANSIQRWPAISPDGNFIAYSGGSDIFSRKIFLESSAGGEPLRLTEDIGDAASPAWSPDGGQLAYVVTPKDGPCRLVITHVPAGSPREVGSCEHDNRSWVIWGPSDQELFFVDQPQGAHGKRIMRLDLATGHRNQVTHPADDSVDESGEALSPNRRFIAFQRCLSNSDCNIVILTIDTGGEQVLRIDPAGLAWEPDSKSLFVATGQTADFALWSVPIDGGPRGRILSSPKIMSRLSVGPHGLLAAEIQEYSSSLARMTTGEGQASPLLAPERGIDCASDIASNSTIAVISRRQGGAGLWLLPKDGQIHKLIELPSDEINSVQPRWSPDGKLIALTTSYKEHLGIRVITALGAEVAFVSANGDMVAAPAWTDAGRALIFPVHKDDAWRLWRAELAAPDASRPLAYMGWSNIRSSGDTLFGVRDGAAGVWRIDDHPERITPFPSSDFAQLWTISDGEIIYPEAAIASKMLLAQPVQGGPSRVAAYALPHVSNCGFSVDPISKAIVHSQVQYFNSDIELLRLTKQ